MKYHELCDKARKYDFCAMDVKIPFVGSGHNWHGKTYNVLSVQLWAEAPDIPLYAQFAGYALLLEIDEEGNDLGKEPVKCDISQWSELNDD